MVPQEVRLRRRRAKLVRQWRRSLASPGVIAAGADRGAISPSELMARAGQSDVELQ